MRIILAIFICVLAALGCNAKNSARAMIVMKDGAVKEDVEIKLPKGWEKKLKIKVGDVEETLNAEDIDYFELWHSDNPSQKALIKSFHIGEYKHKKNYLDARKQMGWMALQSAGEHLGYWIWFKKIILKPDKIKYQIDDNSHCFVKRNSDVAVMIPINLMVPKRTRDWLKAFRADDSELTERITDKGYFNKKNPYHQGNNYNPFFFEDIAVDYNPQR